MIVGDIGRMQQLAGNPYQYSQVIKPDNNHVYYNVTITHFNADAPKPANSDVPVPARFREERVQPIVVRMEDYYFSIIRFSVPTQNLPIFLYYPHPTHLMQLYSPAVTYQVGNVVSFFVGTALHNYQSIANNNIGHTPNTSPLFWLDLGVQNQDPYFSNDYTITLTWNGNTVQEPVTFVPSANSVPPSPPFSVDNTTISNNFNFYTVDSYQQWLDAINLAINAAYMSPLFAGSPQRIAGVPAPFLMYDANTQLISLYADPLFTADLPPGPAGNMLLYFNSDLNDFFNGSLQTIFSGYNQPFGEDYLIDIGYKSAGDLVSVAPPTIQGPLWSALINYNIGTNVSFIIGGVIYNYTSLVTPNIGVAPLIATSANWQQNGPETNVNLWTPTTTYTIGNYVEYNGLFFKVLTGANTATVALGGPLADPTDFQLVQSIQMEQEFSTLYAWNEFKQIAFTTGIIPTDYEFTPNINQAGAMQFKAILTDFEPNQGEGPSNRTVIQYFPQGPYRMIALNGKGPISKTDVQVYWVDAYQNFYPILLGHSDVLTIKMLFRHKNFTGS